MRLFALGALSLAGLTFAQEPANRNLNLVGDRFPPLKFEELTPAQKTMVDHLLSGERRGLGGPFNVLLRSPEMGDAAQQFGAMGRFNASLSRQVNETGIIMTARDRTSQPRPLGVRTPERFEHRWWARLSWSCAAIASRDWDTTK